jgi:glycosyltransferase involved in cell wall biosynthesis
MYKIFREFKPTIIQSWMYHANFYSIFLKLFLNKKTKIYWILTNSSLAPSRTGTKIIAYFLVPLSYFIPKKIIVNGNANLQFHQRIGFANKFINISNGYDFKEFNSKSIKKESDRKELQISSNTIVIGMIARFDRYKDHDTFLEAINLIMKNEKNLLFLLVGKNCTSENNELMYKIKKLKISNHVKLLGYKKNINQIYSVLDLNILASNSESFPNVIAEGMLHGIPSIVSDVGEVKKIVGSTGWIMEKNDPNLLYLYLKKVLKELKNHSKWSERKKMCTDQIIQNYSIEKMVKEYHNVWSKEL